MFREKEILVGASRENIPIEIPTMVAGHINRNLPVSQILDNPQVHTMVIKNHDTQVVLISLDILEIETEECNSIKKIISQACSVSIDSIMIACTHTHTAPPALPIALLEKDNRFIAALISKTIDTVKLAQKSMIPCTIHAGKNQAHVGINRRRIIDGEVVMMPNPEGLQDYDVTGIWFVDREEKAVASIINYSMHPTTLDVGLFVISADYPGYLRRHIERKYPQCKVLFFNGACGDIRPNLIHEDGGFRGGTSEDLEHIGEILGQAALGTFSKQRSEMAIDCICIKKHIDLFFDYDKKITFARTRNETLARQINPVLMDKMNINWEHAMYAKMMNEGMPASTKFIISVYALNTKIALVFLSGEVFVETGLEIKKQSPFELTIVIGYANGTVGYIPTTSAMELGGYEVDEAYKIYGNPAPFVSTSADLIIRESTRLLLAASDALSAGPEVYS